MKWKAVFIEKVFFPFWPLPLCLMFGFFTSPRVHVYWWELAVEIRYVIAALISLRYFWAMKHGAPAIDWMIWLGLAFGLWVVAAVIVSEVAGLVV
jgi:hypothetical protein